MKILFFIDGFRSGGKERRCIELLKGIKDNPQFDIHIVSLRKEIVYPEFYKLNYSYYLIEKDGKLDPIIFIKFYKICKEIKPDIVHCWSSMNAAYSLFAKILLKFKLILRSQKNAKCQFCFLLFRILISRLNLFQFFQYLYR